MIRIQERWRELVKGQVLLFGMEKEIILNLRYVLSLLVLKADESRQ